MLLQSRCNVDEGGREPSLLRLLLEAQGYTLLDPEHQDEAPFDLLLVRGADPSRLELYRAMLKAGASQERRPLVLVSEDPLPVLPGDELHMASFASNFDTRILTETLDKLLDRKIVAPPPVIPKEQLMIEKVTVARAVASLGRPAKEDRPTAQEVLDELRGGLRDEALAAHENPPEPEEGGQTSVFNSFFKMLRSASFT